jgi:hypothetical protein
MAYLKEVSQNWPKNEENRANVPQGLPATPLTFQLGTSRKYVKPSSRTMALGSTQPLTKMSTKNLPGGKKRQARGVDNLTAICEPTV